MPKITSGNIITACVIIVTVAIAWGNIDARVSFMERDLGKIESLSKDIVELKLAVNTLTTVIKHEHEEPD